MAGAVVLYDDRRVSRRRRHVGALAAALQNGTAACDTGRSPASRSLTCFGSELATPEPSP
eukprot:353363-Chlamydomonas_euryale.AAC.3